MLDDGLHVALVPPQYERKLVPNQAALEAIRSDFIKQVSGSTARWDGDGRYRWSHPMR